MKSILAILLILSWGATWQQQPTVDEFGSIEGRVIDSSGQPVLGAKVYPVTPGKTPPGKIPTATTDEHGDFVLDKVYVGWVTLHAFKESDMYHDNVFAFETQANSPLNEVDIKAGQSVKNVMVRTDQKSGLLEVQVLDSDTKQPITGIAIQLCRGDHPGDTKYCIAGSETAPLHQLVPPNPISIKIGARDHYEWTYKDEQTGSPYLALNPGETKSLTVFLRRLGGK